MDRYTYCAYAHDQKAKTKQSTSTCSPYKGEKMDFSRRDFYRCLPFWFLFEILARLSGKPWPGQRPLFDFGGLGWWLVSTNFLIIWFLLLILVSSFIETAGPWNLILVPSVFVMQIILVGRLRVQQVTFGHHAVHGTITRRFPVINKLIAEFSTIISLAQNPTEYRADHVQRHHRTKFFASIHDSDAAFLYELGFRPGMSRKDLYRRLWLTIFSLNFHNKFAKSRFHSTFISSNALHKAAASFWLIMLLSLNFVIDWWVFVIVFVVPFGPLYHISALIQFITEHKWSMQEDGPSSKNEYADRCVGRFSMLQAPAGTTGLRAGVAWAWWLILMVPEVLVRLGAWVGDLPAHDHHHLVGHIGHDPEDWHEAIFERQRSIDAGDPAGLATREVYGLKASLDWVFDGLANA